MENKFEISFNREITEILYKENISLLISTYQAGRVIALGSLDGATLHQVPIGFKKPMGIAVQENKIAIAGINELYFFSNNEDVVSSMNENPKNFDALYMQRAIYNTSNLDVHDIGFGDGILWGVNTLFSCICTFDINYSFRPKWKPPFISHLVPEDRCHLNGLVLENNIPAYVTALSQTNTREGWRDNIHDSGVLMEVPSGKVLIDGLSMPHSPIKVGDKIYLLESGTGDLISWDTKTQKTDVVYSFGKFVRGMCFHGGLLYIGFSKIRQSSKSFNKLDVSEKSHKAGFLIFNLDYKTVVGELDYFDTVEEIYDIKIVKGLNKPLIVNRLDEKYNDVITFPGNVFWKKEKEK